MKAITCQGERIQCDDDSRYVRVTCDPAGVVGASVASTKFLNRLHHSFSLLSHAP